MISPTQLSSNEFLQYYKANCLSLLFCRVIVESQLSLLIEIQRDSALEGKKISLG